MGSMIAHLTNPLGKVFKLGGKTTGFQRGKELTTSSLTLQLNSLQTLIRPFQVVMILCSVSALSCTKQLLKPHKIILIPNLLLSILSSKVKTTWSLQLLRINSQLTLQVLPQPKQVKRTMLVSLVGSSQMCLPLLKQGLQRVPNQYRQISKWMYNMRNPSQMPVKVKQWLLQCTLVARM